MMHPQLRPGSRQALALLKAGCAAATAAAADFAPPDKSGDHLFHPTPRAHLREISTDRPDKTESPHTVDAGHFQIEMDLVAYTHDRDLSGGGDLTTETWAVAPVNLKLGLFHHVDLQLLLDTHQRVRTRDRPAGTVGRQSGFGDFAVRLKQNLWGNDGGQSAFAMMPFVKLPANQDDIGNNAVEGGLIFPLGIGLPGGWSLGAMTEVDLLRNDADQGYHASFVNSLTFGHTIVGNLAGYVEFFSENSAERGAQWIGTVDLGLTYGLTDNSQLDAGINLGVTETADDFNLFIGLSWRF